MRLLEPAGPVARRVARTSLLVELGAKRRIRRKLLDLRARSGAQYRPGIVCEIPQNRIYPPPELIARVIPRRAQIERQLRELPEGLDLDRECPEVRVAGIRSVIRARPSIHRLLAHAPSARRASLTMLCASVRIWLRCSAPLKLSA